MVVVAVERVGEFMTDSTLARFSFAGRVRDAVRPAARSKLLLGCSRVCVFTVSIFFFMLGVVGPGVGLLLFPVGLIVGSSPGADFLGVG